MHRVTVKTASEPASPPQIYNSGSSRSDVTKSTTIFPFTRRWDLLSVWIDAARAGRVIGVYGSPAPSTWARHRVEWDGLQLPPGSPAPRQLRTANKPWGRSDLTLPERRKVDTGNDELRNLILLMAADQIFAFIAVMLHPSDHTPCHLATTRDLIVEAPTHEQAQGRRTRKR